MAGTSSPTQAERRARTRAKVLDAGYEIFAREGYHGATLDAIAARAKVSKGALYYSFDSKEDLFLALLDERLAARAGEVMGNAAAARPPEVTPERWAKRTMQTMRVDREWNLLFWEFACFAARRPEHGQRLVEALRSFRGSAGASLERVLADAGIEPPVPPERLASIIAALANGFALDIILEPGEDAGAAAQRAMATGMALLWRGTASAATERGESDEC
jgi:AcrR family transcriptional regulator